MKTLYVIRHAKSSWDDIALTDFERPLNDRGRKNAPFMGKLLKNFGATPDLMIASPANRALTTARLIAEELHYPFDGVLVKDHLYEGTMHDDLNVIHEIPDTAKTALIVAHNPGLTWLVNFIANANIGNIPTCGVVKIEFPALSWKDIGENTGTVKLFEYPKKHPESDR